MRRRPQAHPLNVPHHPLNLASPQAPIPPSVPSTQGDALEPFLQSGGFSFYPTGYAGGLKPADAGVQLITTQYVPKGRMAFIKRIMVAPCAPPILVDPWRGWGGHFNYFQPGPDPIASPQRAAAQAGLWETPAAWEGYFDATGYFLAIPFWRWSLTMFPGDLAAYRMQQAIPAFNLADPTSWYLAPDFPVPASAYPGGIPGRAPNGYLTEQRIQAPPRAPLSTHILIPEDTTICLWARWAQLPIAPVLAYGPNGPEQPWELPDVYPLLPAVGQLVGYMQAASAEAAAMNAAHGWTA